MRRPAYIVRDDPEAAARIVERIVTSVEGLGAHPASGRPGRVPGTRELVVSGTPYLVPYRVRGETVEILQVFHGPENGRKSSEGQETPTPSRFLYNLILRKSHTMGFERAKLDIDGQIGILKLNHPEVMNAVSPEMVGGLMKALDEVDRRHGFPSDELNR